MGDDVRVLLVDDNPDDRFLIRRLLRIVASDAEIVEATTAEEAIAALRGDDIFDVVLADHFLPAAMSGADVVCYARALRPRPRTVLMSGDLFLARRACRKADAYLDKCRVDEDIAAAVHPRTRRAARAARLIAATGLVLAALLM